MEPRGLRRSLRLPQGGGGRAREVGWGGQGVGLLIDFGALAPIMAGRLWLRLRPSNRLPPPADTNVAESWRGTAPPDSALWRTLVNPSLRSLSTRPTLTRSGLVRPDLGGGADVSCDGLGRSG